MDDMDANLLPRSDLYSIPRKSVPAQTKSKTYRSETDYGRVKIRSRRKPLVPIIDLIALLVSLICLILAVIVISPRYIWSWYLGFQLQLVAIGFLLGVMNLCTQTVLPSLFVALEARTRGSRLQNFQAILTGSFLASRTSLVWRVVILAFIGLPLGLGVAYKRFVGGVSTADVNSTTFKNATYGLGYPPLGDLGTMNNSVYELIHSNAGFLAKSSNDAAIPKPGDYPVALGYNVVLVQENVTAMLDIPGTEYLLWMQDALRGNETWRVSADVNATLARRNDSFANILRTDDDLFDSLFKELTTAQTYNGNEAFGVMSIVDKNTSDSAYMMGSFVSEGYGPLIFGRPRDDPDTEAFRQAAMVFSLSRETCTGTWQIDKTTIKLIAGACDKHNAATLPQEIVSRYLPYSIDTLPVLVHTVGIFDSGRKLSPWRNSAFATAAASSYWARALFILAGNDRFLTEFKYLHYSPQNEKIVSTNSTMKASWPLYLVIAIQPLIAISAAVLTAFLFSTPISRGFGLVSVLSGIDVSTLHLLQGASLSGEIGQPVKLQLDWVPDADVPSVRYRLVTTSEQYEMLPQVR